MTWFSNQKLATKLLVGFGVLFTAMAALGAYSVWALGAVNRSALHIETNWLPSVDHVSAINTSNSDLRVAELQYLVAPDKAHQERFEREMGDQLRLIAQHQAAYELVLSSDEERRHYESFKRQWGDYILGHNRMLELARAGQREEALALIRGSQDAFAVLCNELLFLTDINRKGATAASLAREELFVSSRTWLAVAFAGGLLLSFILARLIARSIAEPARLLGAAADRLACGEVTREMKIDSKDEIGDVARSFVQMQGAIQAVVTETRQMLANARQGHLDQVVEMKSFEGIYSELMTGVVEALVVFAAPIRAVAQAVSVVSSSSHELATVSRQLSASADATSAGANTTAAASEQVSASVHAIASASEEMIISIKEIARMSTTAAQVATEAMKAIENANTTIQKLGVSSVDIGKITTLIASIAQQTNMLALNATIEAARAGEVGKGFAVVASEVKELAKETANATQSIGRQIESIQADAQGAIEALVKIGAIVRDIHGMQTTAAVAVEEQIATTNEIGRSVAEAARASAEISREIRNVAQTGVATAAGAAEIQHTASELARISEDLVGVVAPFKLLKPETSPRVAPAPPRHVVVGVS
jgi:methyl-accepting chemotaxis protein